VSATQELVRFGVFELNVTTEELRKSGTLIRLAPQPLKLLVLLARRSGQVVTRDEIQQTLWGGETYVDFEQGMNHCVKQIRTALSDSADTPLYIETVPRRGYRFLAPVVTKTIPAPPPRVVESQSGIQTGAPVKAAVSATTLPATPIATVPAMLRPPHVAAPAPPPDVPPVATATPAVRKRTPWKAVLVAVVLLAVVLAAIFFYWRSRKVAFLNEKDTIVVADVENTTGDPVFDNSLKQALAVGLEQSPFLNVLSDQKVTEQLEFMGLAPDARLTRDTARQLCQRSGSKAVMTGSISGVSGRYLVALKAVDCSTGETLDSEQAEAGSRAQVLSALGQATRRMREKLGESLASLQKYDVPLEQATTPSLDALKAYSLSVKTGNAQGYAAAVPYLKSAIDLDPNFAMAYARLGVEYFNLNQPTLAAQYTTKAYQLRDRTSEREKLYIVSHYHDLVTGNADQTIAAYQLFQQAYPREEVSYMNLNSWYNAVGQYDEALAQAKSALQLDAGNAINYQNLALTYLYLNRGDDAGAVLEQAKSRQLPEQALLANLYEVAFLKGDTAAMARYVAEGAGKPGIEDSLLALQSDTEAYHGRLNKARELTRAAQASAAAAGSREADALWQLAGALHEAELGDAQRARQQASAALAGNDGKNVRILAALILARSGDRQRAQALADQLVKEYPADTLVNDYWVPSIRAAIALSDKDPSAAITALQPATHYETGSPPTGIAMYPLYLRGLAYLQQGRGAEAAMQFDKMLKYPGVVLNLATASLAQLQLARAQAMASNAAAARKSYAQFLALWKDADPDLPLLKQAQAEYARLR